METERLGTGREIAGCFDSPLDTGQLLLERSLADLNRPMRRRTSVPRSDFDVGKYFPFTPARENHVPRAGSLECGVIMQVRIVR